MLVTSQRTGDLGTSLNHPRDPAKGLGAHLERLVQDMPEQVDEGVGQLALVSFMGITENLSIMVVLEDTAYIMVR